MLSLKTFFMFNEKHLLHQKRQLVLTVNRSTVGVFFHKSLEVFIGSIFDWFSGTNMFFSFAIFNVLIWLTLIHAEIYTNMVPKLISFTIHRKCFLFIYFFLFSFAFISARFPKFFKSFQNCLCNQWDQFYLYFYISCFHWAHFSKVFAINKVSSQILQILYKLKFFQIN